MQSCSPELVLDGLLKISVYCGIARKEVEFGIISKGKKIKLPISKKPVYGTIV